MLRQPASAVLLLVWLGVAAMFEKYVSSIILTLANKYIKNVNASELKLSLWGTCCQVRC